MDTQNGIYTIDGLNEIDLENIISEINLLINPLESETTTNDSLEQEDLVISAEEVIKIGENEIQRDDNQIENKTISIGNFISRVLVEKEKILNGLKQKLTLLSEKDNIEDISDKEFINYLIVYLKGIDNFNEEGEKIGKLIDTENIDVLINSYNAFILSNNKDIFREKVCNNISLKNQKKVGEESLQFIETNISHPRQSEYFSEYLNKYPERKEEILDIIKFSIDCPIVLSLIEKGVSIEKLSGLIKKDFDFYLIKELVDKGLNLKKVSNLINNLEIGNLHKIFNRNIKKDNIIIFINTVEPSAIIVFIKEFKKEVIEKILCYDELINAELLFNSYMENNFYQLLERAENERELPKLISNLGYFIQSNFFNLSNFNDFLINSGLTTNILKSFIVNGHYQKEKVNIVFDNTESKKFGSFLNSNLVDGEKKARILNHCPNELSKLINGVGSHELCKILKLVNEDKFLSTLKDNNFTIDGLINLININNINFSGIADLFNNDNLSIGRKNFFFNQKEEHIKLAMKELDMEQCSEEEVNHCFALLRSDVADLILVNNLLKEDKDKKILKLIEEKHNVNTACIIGNNLNLSKYEIGELREISRAISGSEKGDALKIEALNETQITILLDLHNKVPLTKLNRIAQQNVVFAYEMIEKEEDKEKKEIYKEDFNKLLENSDVSGLNQKEISNLVLTIEEEEIRKSKLVGRVMGSDIVFKNNLFELVEKGNVSGLNKEDVSMLTFMLQSYDLDKELFFKLLHSTNVSGLKREDIEEILSLLSTGIEYEDGLFRLIREGDVKGLKENDLRIIHSLLTRNSGNGIPIYEDGEIVLRENDLFKLTKNTNLSGLTKDDIINILCLLKKSEKENDIVTTRGINIENPNNDAVNEEVLYELIGKGNVAGLTEHNIIAIVGLLENKDNKDKKELIYKVLNLNNGSTPLIGEEIQFIVNSYSLYFDDSIFKNLIEHYEAYKHLEKGGIDLKKLFRLINGSTVREDMKKLGELLVHINSWSNYSIIMDDYEKFVFKLKGAKISKIRTSISNKKELPIFPVYRAGVKNDIKKILKLTK